MTTTNPGIDYGLGQTNTDHETGIRFGVISQHDVSPDSLDDIFQNGDDLGFEAYRDHVKAELQSAIENAINDYTHRASEAVEKLDYEQMFDDLELGESYESGGESGPYRYDDGSITVETNDTDLFVTKSPYFTWAQFCSPCAPGAGHLGNPMPEDEGAKTYCLDREWFTDEKCPYPYWSVETGELIYSP
jgi:hypothetical protein